MADQAKRPKRKNGAPKGHFGNIPFTAEELATFLDELCKYGNVSEAAAQAGLGRLTLYRRRRDDPEFAKAWDEALAIGTQALEDEAKRRAFSGWEEPVWSQGRRAMEPILDPETGQQAHDPITGELQWRPAAVRKYSDTLLIFLMKGLKPEVYKERVASEVSGPGGGPIQTQAMDLSRLTTEELRQLKALSEKAAGRDTDDRP